MAFLLGSTGARALGSPVETTLRMLLEEHGLDTGRDLLASLSELSACLNHFKLSCVPPIGEGDLDGPRVLASESPSSIAWALDEISRLETATVEFKSTLLLDVKRLHHDPGKPLAAYRSDAMIESALKTIAAFANTGGGTLYLGVEDSGKIHDLKKDYEVADAKRGDYDGWDQQLRMLIRSRLSDGSALNAYVRTACFQCDDGQFVQARVAPRTRLTFLKTTSGSWELYIRVGTQTNAIAYHEIEQHFMLRRLY